MSHSTRQSVLFEQTFRKPVQVEFDAESQTSDGGLVLLGAADGHLGLTEALCAEITDPRQPGKVGHSMLDLVRQRVYALAQGYPDGTDAARLARDPGLRFACERSIDGEDALASQSTLSRFENLITARDAVRMLRHLFDERPYRTRSWPHARRVLLKAEALPYAGRTLKSNPRYVVTNLRQKPHKAFALYYGRGDVENRIKELKCDLAIDRTSCSRFVANQFRVILTSAAYLLLQELRWRLRRTPYARAQVGRLRTTLLKVSARVVESVRRIVFRLPRAYAFAEDFARAACALGARRRQPAT